MKCCSKCGVEKRLDEYTKNSASKDGYRPDCKDCQKKVREQFAPNYVSRACKTCMVEKLAEQFPKRSRKCRKCCAAESAMRRQIPGNKEKQAAQDKARFLEKGELLRAQNKIWRMENAEYLKDKTYEWREKNPDRFKQHNKKWRTKNLPYIMASNASRRALTKNATPAWADKKKIQAFYESAQGIGMLTGEWYHVDHIVPLKSKTVCGLHCEANLQILTAKENIVKNNLVWPDMPDKDGVS